MHHFHQNNGLKTGYNDHVITETKEQLQQQFMLKMNNHLNRINQINDKQKLVQFYKNDRRFIEVPLKTLRNEGPICKMRIMTYNILADGKKYALSRYHGYCPEEYRLWEYRFNRLKAQFEAYEPDIVCIQETTKRSWNNKMKPALLKMGYVGIHGTRNIHEQERGLVQSDCVIYRADRVTAIKHRIIRLKVSNKQKNKYYHSCMGSKKSMFRAFLSTYNDVAIVVHFQCNETKKQFIVCSSHFYWDPSKPEMKAAQTLIFNHELEKLLLEDDEWKWPKNGYGQSIYEENKENVFNCNIDNSNNAYNGGNLNANSNNKNANDCKNGDLYETDLNKIPIIFGVDANAIAFKDYKDEFDPDMPSEGASSGVYELMLNGELLLNHRDHPHGRINWREARYQKELKNRKKDDDDRGFVENEEDRRIRRLSMKEVEHVAHLKDWEIHMKWKSVYSMVNVRNEFKEPVFTNKSHKFCGAIDYIFVSGMVDVRSFLEMPYQRHLTYHILTKNHEMANCKEWVQEQLSKEEKMANAFDLLPNVNYPSDHLPLCSDIIIIQ